MSAKKPSTRLRCTLLAVAWVVASTTTSRGSERAASRQLAREGAAIVAANVLTGEREIDDVLDGAGLGAGLGDAVDAYMDGQEERFARIPGTMVERVAENLLLVRLDADLLFRGDSSKFGDDATATLDRALEVLLEYAKTAMIAQGHTDSTGPGFHNRSLSERRARAVAEYFVEEGMNPARIAAVGYGEAFPVADNRSAQGRHRNRRVDLLLKAKVD